MTKKKQSIKISSTNQKSNYFYCATMKVYHYLQTDSPYAKGDTVTGLVYEVSDNFGVFVAVDEKYSALIPKQEAQGNYKPGEELTCRVTEVREDGKLTLSAKKKAYIQLHEDAESVYEIIQEFDGELPFDDKAAPEVIQREFGLSKNAFKRAVGHLLKEKKIEMKNGKIYALWYFRKQDWYGIIGNVNEEIDCPEGGK